MRTDIDVRVMVDPLSFCRPIITPCVVNASVAPLVCDSRTASRLLMSVPVVLLESVEPTTVVPSARRVWIFHSRAVPEEPPTVPPIRVENVTPDGFALAGSFATPDATVTPAVPTACWASPAIDRKFRKAPFATVWLPDQVKISSKKVSTIGAGVPDGPCGPCGPCGPAGPT